MLTDRMSSRNKTACCVFNCLSTTSDLTFKFPSKELEGISWLKAIKSNELNALNYTDIVKQKRGVCFKHFTENAVLVLSSGKKILKKGFLPDLSIQYPCAPSSSNFSEVLETPGKKGKLASEYTYRFFFF